MNKFHITIEYESPPRRMAFIYHNEELFQLIVKEIMAQNEAKVNHKSITDISKVLLHAFDIFPNLKNKRPMGLSKCKNKLLEILKSNLPDIV